MRTEARAIFDSALEHLWREQDMVRLTNDLDRELSLIAAGAILAQAYCEAANDK